MSVNVEEIALSVDSIDAQERYSFKYLPVIDFDSFKQTLKPLVSLKKEKRKIVWETSKSFKNNREVDETFPLIYFLIIS